MSDHFHSGSSSAQRTRAAATDEAIRSWADFTALEYGSDWARFWKGSRPLRSDGRATPTVGALVQKPGRVFKQAAKTPTARPDLSGAGLI